MLRRARSRFAVAIFSILLAACESTTAIVVHLDAPADMRAMADTLRVRIYDTNRQLVRDDEVDVSGLEFPANVPIYPGADLPRSFHLEAELLAADGSLVADQRLIGGFKPDEEIVLPIAFDDACPTPCSGIETCISGICQPACYDETLLVSGSRPSARACEQVVFVDSENGEDATADCLSPARPCASVAQAQSFLVDDVGGQVWIRGGMTYESFGIVRSGAPDARLRFRPWPGTGTPVVDGLTQTSDQGAIYACCGDTSQAHFTIEDLEVREAQGAGVYLHGEVCTDVVVRGMNIHSGRPPIMEQQYYVSAMAAIIATNMLTNIVIEDNWVHDNVGVGPAQITEDVFEDTGLGGIATSNNPGPMTITGNLVEDNAGYGISAIGAILVAQNVVRRNGGNGIQPIEYDLVVEQNVVCDNVGAGIFVTSTDDIVIRHNTVVGSGGPGLLLTNWSSGTIVEDDVFAFGMDVGIGWVPTTNPKGTVEPVGASEPLDDYNFIFGNTQGDYRDIEPGANNRLEDPRLEGVAECEPALANGSPLRGAARDGLDIGADLAALAPVFALDD